MPSHVSAIILAAGLSSRMGDENKLFLPYQGESLLGNVIDRAGSANVSEVIVVTSPLLEEQVERINEHRGRNFKTVINKDFQKGMTTSIQCGVRSSYKESCGWMICLGDMPKIVTAEYDRILDQFIHTNRDDPRAIAVPYFGDEKGNPIIFSSSYKTEILAHCQKEGCREIVKQNEAHVVKVSMDTGNILVDVDTKRDYQRLM